MKVYVAGPWKHREIAQSVAAFLTHGGHTITARWLQDHEDSNDQTHLRLEALHDEADVLSCDALVLLHLEGSRGGMWTEFGMARIAGKKLIVVGKPTGNVFYYLPGVHWAADLDEVLALLQ